MTLQQCGIALFALAIMLEQAHVISPIVLAWTHGGLRRIALQRWPRCVAAPIIILVASILSPFWFVWGLYAALNMHHFGAQNFGILSLYRKGWKSPDARVIGWLLCVGGTILWMIALPFTAILDWSHWITDITLSSRVSRYWWGFLVAVCLLGCLGFLWLVPRVDHIATHNWPLVIKARWGVGFVHFLYSAWIWKLSDPQIKAVIGRDLVGA